MTLYEISFYLKFSLYLEKLAKSHWIYIILFRIKKNWKKPCLYTIYNTNCKKKTTIREVLTTVQSIIAKFRNGWFSKYTNGWLTASKDNLSDNVKSGWSFKISFTKRIWEMH